ncbi:helix-turn-helix transcriptional regulator [Deinococcus cellulosilyticus]|uniref:HTH cro/C1-type domain-containing protein n=1 Tax=Deinococcus cellulosilyticus (strain DSM 18568 / NBRC 106333 / KACC 11606 / 5516J-15) TaxID=1223518 RepID=A0A511NBC2_DEIC1|nr:hypothetical protein [Deinococcus cellulosilyticus]GEM50104.1 hypothetical protein DC3_57390 [Deinococcus cellulosilyticus NBRC 106333 = KACC 11606]
MDNSDDHRHGTLVSIGQYLTLELQSRSATLLGFSKQLDCPEELLQQILEGTTPLTPEVALKIERCWGISMKLLLDLQHEHQQHMASSQRPEQDHTSQEVR